MRASEPTRFFSKKELEGFNPEKDFSKSFVLPSVFPFRQQGHSGQWVSSIFPHLSRVIDDVAIIKSMHAASPIHSVGQILMHTGYNRPGFPSLGSWLSYGLGSENQDMPSFVVMRDGPSTDSSGGAAMYHSGFLPSIHQAMLVETKSDRPPIPNLVRSADTTLTEQQRQLELMTELNLQHQQQLTTQPEVGCSDRCI